MNKLAIEILKCLRNITINYSWSFTVMHFEISPELEFRR